MARARWRQRPDANLGVATGPASGIWALDVDPRHGGTDSLAALEARHGPLPPTVQVATPSGGCHLYWRWQADGPEIRNSASRIAPGLDVRGVGGYVVAPPSVLDSSTRYRWVDTGGTQITAAPAWLVGRAKPTPIMPVPPPRSISVPGDVARYVATAIADELRRVTDAQEGVRNDQLNRSAFAIGQFVSAGAIDRGWAQAELERRALATGLSLREARATITSGLTAGLANPKDLGP